MKSGANSWDRSRRIVACALVSAALVASSRAARAYEVQCGVEGGDSFGWSVASGSDFDGDGTPDYAIGAPCASVRFKINETDTSATTLFRTGRVKIISGATGRELFSLHGTTDEQLLGSALAWVPDLDGDGKPELAVGSAAFNAPQPTRAQLLAAGQRDVHSSR